MTKCKLLSHLVPQFPQMVDDKNLRVHIWQGAYEAFHEKSSEQQLEMLSKR